MRSKRHLALIMDAPYGGVKKLFVVEDAEHIDLYGRTNSIPFDKLEDFYKKYLK